MSNNKLSPWDFVWIDDQLNELQNRWQTERVGFDWDDMQDFFREIAEHYYQLGYELRLKEQQIEAELHYLPDVRKPR